MRKFWRLYSESKVECNPKMKLPPRLNNHGEGARTCRLDLKKIFQFIMKIFKFVLTFFCDCMDMRLHKKISLKSVDLVLEFLSFFVREVNKIPILGFWRTLALGMSVPLLL